MSDDSWVFRVIPVPGESLGHFLGRFRRANQLSHRAIADHLGVRVRWVEDWERPSRRCNPTELQRIALSKLVEVDPQQLVKMLPPARLHLQTRLCAACYEETPVHLANWQRESNRGCDTSYAQATPPPCSSVAFHLSKLRSWIPHSSVVGRRML